MYIHTVPFKWYFVVKVTTLVLKVRILKLSVYIIIYMAKTEEYYQLITHTSVPCIRV